MPHSATQTISAERHSDRHLEVDEAATADVTPGTDTDADAVLTLTIDTGRCGSVELTGTCWTLHRLIIDLDRELTRMARRTTWSATY